MRRVGRNHRPTTSELSSPIRMRAAWGQIEYAPRRKFEAPLSLAGPRTSESARVSQGLTKTSSESLDMNRLLSGVIVLVLTLLSGLMDAKGFVYAARAWPEGRLDLRFATASMLSFFAGLSLYIAAVRFMKTVGVSAVALQSGIWFIVTACGLAVMDGSVLQWSRTQKVVAVLVAAGLGWLLATAHGEGH